MKSKEMLSLNAGATVVHKRYGESIVVDLIDGFGPSIIPATLRGRMLLQADSGCPDCPLNELWRKGVPYLASDYKRNLTNPQQSK